MTNSLYALGLNKLKPVSTWSSDDINEVLSCGDKMYLDIAESRNISRYLYAEELPENVTVQSSVYRVSKLNISGGLLFVQKPSTVSLLGALETALQDQQSGCIVILSIYAISFIRSNNGYYCVDSHSRGNDGMSNPKGRAVVMRVGNNCQHAVDFVLKLGRSLGLHMQRLSRYEVIPIQLIQHPKSFAATPVNAQASEAHNPSLSSDSTTPVNAQASEAHNPSLSSDSTTPVNAQASEATMQHDTPMNSKRSRLLIYQFSPEISYFHWHQF